jgi:spore germination cell wall hydrolase CwlJ-like protein
MKKLLVIILIITLLCTSYVTKVYAKPEEGIAGINLNEVDGDDIKTAFNNLKFTKRDVKILYKIIEAECEGQSKKDKKNVTSVIINRLLNGKFGNSVYEVVFAENQFSSIDNKRYDNAKPTNDTKDAVDDVLDNGVTTEATYYSNLDNVTQRMRNWFYSSFTYLFTDDANHSFFKEK